MTQYELYGECVHCGACLEVRLSDPDVIAEGDRFRCECTECSATVDLNRRDVK